MGKLNVITPNTRLSAGSVSTSFIKDNAVTTDKIIDDAVTTDKIVDGAITSAKIGVDVIVAEDIANNAITVAELQDNAVTTAKILDANVTEAKIADGSITAAKIADGTVVEAELADDAVTTDKIIDDAVTLAKINTSGAWDFDDKMTISATGGREPDSYQYGYVEPVLNLISDGTGYDNALLMLTDSTDDVCSIISNVNTGNKYQIKFVMDPNNTVGSDETSDVAGDYFFRMGKDCSDESNIKMNFVAVGAHGGFNIQSYDTSAHSWGKTPIALAGSDLILEADNDILLISENNIAIDSSNEMVLESGVEVKVEVDDEEKMVFNDYGMSICNGAVVHGLDRNTSNHQFLYTGTCTTGTAGVPAVRWIFHRRDAHDRVSEILEATDYGSGDAAIVEIGKQLTVNPVKVASAVPVELANLSSAPGSPTAGMMYYDTTTDKFRGYQNGAWINLDGT